MLKLHQNGTIAKDINAILNPPKPAPTPAPTPKILYKVQCGAFAKKANAVTYMTAIKKAGFDAIMKEDDKYWKIQVGAYSEKANAEAMLKKIKAAGFGGVIVTQKV